MCHVRPEEGPRIHPTVQEGAFGCASPPTSTGTWSTSGWCREAERRECDVVILGGDLAPRGNGYGYHELGALRDYLPHLPNGKPDWASDRALEYMQEGYYRRASGSPTSSCPSSSPVPF